MADLVNPHATLFLPGDAAVEIEAMRRTWDPLHAASIAAHVTLAYPWEIANLDAMARAAAAAADAGLIRLGLDGPRLVTPAGPLVVEAIDVAGSFARARLAGGGPRARAVGRASREQGRATRHTGSSGHERSSGRGVGLAARLARGHDRRPRHCERDGL